MRDDKAPNRPTVHRRRRRKKNTVKCKTARDVRESQSNADPAYQERLLELLDSVPKDHQPYLDSKQGRVTAIKYGGMFPSVLVYQGNGKWA